MNSAAPFPIPSLHPEGELTVALEAFRWLLILGFPAAVAAATVCPDTFSLGETFTPTEADPVL
jgi:hypothetical protein